MSSELAAATAVVLALAIWLAGGAMVALLTSLPDVAATARAFLPWTGLYVLLSVAAFQLDGIFIGATWTRAMRNASMVSLAAFVLCAGGGGVGNHGLWAAFVVFVVARALALLPSYRHLARPYAGFRAEKVQPAVGGTSTSRSSPVKCVRRLADQRQQFAAGGAVVGVAQAVSTALRANTPPGAVRAVGDDAGQSATLAFAHRVHGQVVDHRVEVARLRRRASPTTMLACGLSRRRRTGQQVLAGQPSPGGRSRPW